VSPARLRHGQRPTIGPPTLTCEVFFSRSPARLCQPTKNDNRSTHTHFARSSSVVPPHGSSTDKDPQSLTHSHLRNYFSRVSAWLRQRTKTDIGPPTPLCEVFFSRVSGTASSTDKDRQSLDPHSLCEVYFSRASGTLRQPTKNDNRSTTLTLRGLLSRASARLRQPTKNDNRSTHPHLRGLFSRASSTASSTDKDPQSLTHTHL